MSLMWENKERVGGGVSVLFFFFFAVRWLVGFFCNHIVTALTQLKMGTSTISGR